MPELKKQNVETIIVLLHEGGNDDASPATAPAAAPTGSTSAPASAGVLPPIVERMDDEIDVVVTGHTNWAINCVIDGKIVTGAAANGRIVTDIDLTISRASKDVVAAKVNNVAVDRATSRRRPT